MTKKTFAIIVPNTQEAHDTLLMAIIDRHPIWPVVRTFLKYMGLDFTFRINGFEYTLEELEEMTQTEDDREALRQMWLNPDDFWGKEQNHENS